MLSKTSELAIQSLVFMLLVESDECISPGRIAEATGASPTYTAKVTALLVRAGILKAQRGARGGVQLGREPGSISLMDIVEACQGKILGDFCQEHDDMTVVCSYHEAMNDLHNAIVGVLKRWTLADMITRPCPHKSIRDSVACKLKWVEKMGVVD